MGEGLKRAFKAARATRHHQVVEGEWTLIPMKGHHNMCCDCANVHVIDYRQKVSGRLEMRVRVNRRATAAARRAFKFTPEVE